MSLLLAIFSLGSLLESLPDPHSSLQAVATLRRWNLCQALVRHFWKRWSLDYFSSLRRCSKWHSPSRNLKVGDIVMLREESFVPAKWPLGKIIDLYPGKDRSSLSRQRRAPTYRPVVKVALLLPAD